MPVVCMSWCASATVHGVFVEVIQLVVELGVVRQCHRSWEIAKVIQLVHCVAEQIVLPVPQIMGKSRR